MLLLVLALVIVALGLLVAALVTAVMLWAWGSVGASALAAALLVVDWWRRRRLVAPPAAARPDPVAPPPRAAPDDDAGAVTSAHDADPDLDRDTEPVEEDTDAADLLAVAELSTEVRVVDERPRYHLATCRWLGGRSTLGLPVREARELGFTPCAICAPDSTLAATHRSTT